MTQDQSKMQSLATDLWTMGAGHAEAAGQLISVAKDLPSSHGLAAGEAMAFNGGLSPSIHLLIGNGFEVLLKAAFIHCGGDEKALKAIGHDLLKALVSAKEVGFESKVANLQWVLEGLRAAHLDHQFRYGTHVEVNLPPLAITAQTLQALVMELGFKIYNWQLPRGRG